MKVAKNVRRFQNHGLLIFSLFIISCEKNSVEKTLRPDTYMSTKGRVKTSTNLTGQGIMIDFDVKGTYTVIGTSTYELDLVQAKSIYTNTWNGAAPTLSCKGENFSGGNGSSCNYTTAPIAPPAPAPLDEELISQIDKEACILLNGGILIGSTYTQTATNTATYQINGITKTSTYTYTYNINPIISNVVEFTAWNQVASDIKGLNIPVNAKIAGLSAKTWADGKKYSFSLSSPDLLDPSIQLSRISGVQIQLVNATTNAVISSIQAPHNLDTNWNTDLLKPALRGEIGAVDFKFYQNAGTNGTLSLLPTSSTDGSISVDARELLNTDKFDGNQDGGADGRALQIAVVPSQKLPVSQPGDYLVRIIANVKGNDGSADQAVSIQQRIRVIANCRNSF